MASLMYRDPADSVFKALPVAGGITHEELSYGTDDDHPQYQTMARGDARWLKVTGGGYPVGTHPNDDPNRIDGQLEIDWPGTLYLHNAGSYHIRLKAGNLNGYALRVEDPSDASLRSIIVGTPTTWDHLSSWGWTYGSMSDQVTGPHGPQTVWYDIGADGVPRTYPNGALWMPVKNEPGLWKVQCSVDMYIDQSHSAGTFPEIFFSMSARWNDTGSLSWHNGNPTCTGRLSIQGGAYGSIQTGTFIGYVDNRPGYQLLFCGQASGQGGSNIKYIGGDYRLTCEFYPWSTRTMGAQWVNF